MQNYCKNYNQFIILFRMSLFGAATDGGGTKIPLPKICHIYPTMMKLGTVIPYLKNIQKIYKSCETPLKSCWHLHFFTGNWHFLLYQEIQMSIAFWYIFDKLLIHFVWVFKGCYNNHSFNFDDVSKIGYSRPS